MFNFLFVTELDIGEVGHDTVVALKKELEARGIENAYDTWHSNLLSYDPYNIAINILILLSNFGNVVPGMSSSVVSAQHMVTPV